MDFNSANLAIAIFVPLLSVYAAQLLASQHAKREDAKEAFIGINRHLQEFVYTFMNLRRHPANALAGEDGRRRADELAQILINCVVNLENDCMVLGMIFDRRADSVGIQIRALSSRSKLLLEENSPAPPPPDNCYELLRRDMDSVIVSVKDLWKNEINRPFLRNIKSLFIR